MSREQFEKWALTKGIDISSSVPGDIYYSVRARGAYEGYDARQPEIDALTGSRDRAIADVVSLTQEKLNQWSEIQKLKAEVERLRAQIRESSDFEFQIGDRVEKFTGDYKLEGIVVGHAVTIAGHVRYVVEHRPLAPGMLHIYGGNNIRLKVGE